MAPPFSSSDYDTLFSLTINSSNIINGTIIGADIANGTITDANIAVGTITEAKLSSALQTKLANFGTRLTALESTPPPSGGWSGNLIISRSSGGGTQTIVSVKTEAGFIVNQVNRNFSTGSYTISVTLPTLQSYLYISLTGAGSWEIQDEGFLNGNISPTSVFENNISWFRFTIPSQFIGSNLNYDFQTYYND
jgi:hypothetical protein